MHGSVTSMSSPSQRGMVSNLAKGVGVGIGKPMLSSMSKPPSLGPPSSDHDPDINNPSAEYFFTKPTINSLLAWTTIESFDVARIAITEGCKQATSGQRKSGKSEESAARKY